MVNIGNTVFIFFTKPNFSFTNKRTLSTVAIVNTLKSVSGATTDKIIVRDDKKYTWDLASWDEFFKFGYIKERKYVPEVFDCDKYTDVMKGQVSMMLGNAAFGTLDHDRTVTSDAHSINFFIDSSRKVWIYEPQTGEVESYASYSKRVGCVPRYFLL